MEWFRRFGDILDYTIGLRVDRSKIEGHGDVPRVTSQYLSWPIKGGTTSASPAHRHWGSDRSRLSTSKLLLNMAEALELPGIPSDYHFIIQGAAESLWARTRQEPQLLDMIERLCWLDIRLIQAKPRLIRVELRGARALAFKWLIDLREREGFLREAFEVAELAAAFEQGTTHSQRLRDRIAGLEAEDASLNS